MTIPDEGGKIAPVKNRSLRSVLHPKQKENDVAMKRALQAILISPDPKMRLNAVKGRKQITIREGERDYTEGPTMLCCEKEPWAVMVDVTNVRHCTLAEVTREEYEADGFTSPEDMLAGMRVFYKTMTMESPVTVVRWHNVRGKYVDQPKSHSEHLLSLRIHAS